MGFLEEEIIDIIVDMTPHIRALEEIKKKHKIEGFLYCGIDDNGTMISGEGLRGWDLGFLENGEVKLKYSYNRTIGGKKDE